MKQNDEVLNSPSNMETDSLAQREMIQLSPPVSIPNSPVASPITTQVASSPLSLLFNTNATNDPNWQATKPTIRERNAAMFNNELMADIHFIVGNDGNVYSPYLPSSVSLRSHRYKNTRITLTHFPCIPQETRKEYQRTNIFWLLAVRFSTPCFTAAYQRNEIP